ncbi:MAG: AMP-dependent synthetase/ligase [Promethearchaeota archaeon]
MRWFAEDGDTVESITYAQLERYIEISFHALYSLGLKKGDHVAICAETSHVWAWADLGIQCLGAVTVAIYPSLKPKEILYILKDSESKVIFIDNRENLNKFYSIEDELPNIQNVIIFEDIDKFIKKENVITWNEFFERGKDHEKNHHDLLQKSIDTINEEDLASLIYTSGTTGSPKGVMLTHKNFLSDIVLISAIGMTLDKGEKPWEGQSITYMPYAHSYARTVEEYGLIFNGSTINFVGGRTQERLEKAFKRFKPTIMIGVPYLFQKLYERIIDTVATMPPKIQKIFNNATSIGKKYYLNKSNKRKNPLSLKIKYRFYKILVLNRIKKELGGKLQLLVTAAAAISQELFLFFYSCGFNIAEGYGLTEAAPATHYSRTWHNSDFRPNFHKKIDIYEKLGTVGPPLEIIGNPYENIQQKLGPDGELLLKGPNIMKGYWKKPKLTKVAIDEEGWLHTGDLVEIDEDGYVKIIGRSKAIIKLSTGKMISPALVEGLIVPYSLFIAQIILVGSEKKYLTAIVVPYQKSLKKYADEHGIPYKSWKDIIENKEIQALIKKDIMKFTEEIAEFSRPKRFAISSKNFSMEDGYLTPTLKFKRNKIYEDFKDIIDKLYEIDDDFLIIESRMTDFYDQNIIA